MTARSLTILSVCALAPIIAGCDDDVSGVDREAPPIPAGVYSITGDELVEIRWSPLVGADVAGYNVYASTEPDRFRTDDRIASVFGEAVDYFVDSGLENGVTFYYAVTSFDFSGNESGYSTESVFDTPRPAGSGVTLFAPSQRPSQSGIDWSEYSGGRATLVVPYDSPYADFVIEERDGVLRLRGTTVIVDDAAIKNDIQDFGFSESLDDVSWAPDSGWAESPDGVELISGHAYIVWTWDNYYGKFRITGRTSMSATLEWAYQATDDFEHRFELAPVAPREPR